MVELLRFAPFNTTGRINLSAIDDRRLGRRQFAYDLAGRLRSVRAGREVLESYDFDNEGNLLSSPDYRNARTTAGNRMVTAGDFEDQVRSSRLSLTAAQ